MQTNSLLEHSTEKPYIDPFRVRERDIDLLLVEELYASESFREHFLNLLHDDSLPEHLRFQSAQRSIWDDGQCDLQIELYEEDENRCWLLLIENKIDAEFQPNQAANYCKRGEKYKRKGRCSEYRIALIAPQQYLKVSTGGFDKIGKTVSYEEICDWYESERASELGSRRIYKIALLNGKCQSKHTVDRLID